MNEISNLEPKALWNNFIALNQVPRPSKKEEKVRQFMNQFGKDLGLPVSSDEVGNVLITKPASPGMESRKKVILQSHLDMVCQKNNDINFDFDTEGIEMYIEDGFVRAKGTTLGADNGIGVSSIMAILASKDIPHPALEAFFTIDEETGMTGALGLKAGFLSGEILLNLDTEEDNELDIGCAGGLDITAIKSYTPATANDTHGFELYIKGLKGGHSGIQIHEGFGNANKLIARFLNQGLSFDIQIANMESGGLRNAIPREGKVRFVIPSDKEESFQKKFEDLKTAILNEYKSLEPNLNISLTQKKIGDKVLSVKDSSDFIKALMVAFNGVFRMSPDVAGLVETSNNVANIIIKNGEIKIACLTRSSVESGKENLAQILKDGFELAGFSVQFSGGYPGWEANTSSDILKLMKALYKEKFKEEPLVVACHAGLECGIIGTNYPGLDMISFGPNIYGAHSPDERVEIKSVQKFWSFLTDVLKAIPEVGK